MDRHAVSPARKSRHLARAILAASLLLLVPPAARAGGNADASAYLSWNATDKTASDLTTPGSSNALYIHVERAAGLSFKGGEADLTWDPAGDEAGCFDRIGFQFRTSTGCTYLNRGTALHIITADDPSHFHISWSNTTSVTDCTAGVAMQVTFEFDGCAAPRGCITLNAMSLLDAANVTDVIDRPGSDATVTGGSELCGARPRTWFVNPASTCSPCDGTSWTTAVHTLGQGIALARANLSDSIMVAQGRYAESGLTPPGTTQILAGWNQTGTQRNPAQYRTLVTAATGGTTPFLLDLPGVTLDGLAIGGIVDGLGPVEISAHDITLRGVRLQGNRTVPGSALVDILGASANILLDRCVFAGNAINNSYGMISVAGGVKVDIEDCDFVNNTNTDTTGAMVLFSPSLATVRNCIVWRNSPGIPAFVGSQLTVSTCDVEGGWTGTGNINSAPLFCNAATGNFALRPTSPCVGTGHDGTTIGAIDVLCGAAGGRGNIEGGNMVAGADDGGEPQPAAVDAALPARFRAQPVVAATRTEFVLRGAGGVAVVQVFDSAGRLVRALRAAAVGGVEARAAWDLTDTAGRRVPAGVYRARGGDRLEAAVIVLR